jgi:hypothetical protein
MLSKSVRAVVIFVTMSCLFLGLSATARAVAPASHADRNTGTFATPAGVLYSQPPTSNGVLYQSSRNGTDYDQYVWDNFAILSGQTISITEIKWRGGYDPLKFGSGGPVVAFRVAIYPSIAGGTQPDVTNPPLVDYLTGGNAGETLVGTFGGTIMYDYTFVLPAPFHAMAGTKYWVQIEASQSGIPDWGIAAGTGGDGSHFRRTANAGDVFYQIVPGDAAFTLLGSAGNAHRIYLPLMFR